MDPSEPLDGQTSGVEAAALRVLARTDAGFSGRRVHALAAVGSTSSIHRALALRDSNLDSDVDLFLVFPDDDDPDVRAESNYRLATHVERVTGNEAQVVAIDRAELARRLTDDDQSTVNVLRDGILVFGDPLPPAPGRAA